MIRSWTAGFLMLSGAALAATVTSSGVTFHKDVLPILQKNCQNCHRAGQIGPMSLLTYDEVRPWAKSIKQAVLTKKMPPWFADPQYGHFSNDRTLKPAEVTTLVKWVDDGAIAGDSKDAPPPIAWPEEGWRIRPDHIVKGVAYHVPKSGVMPWMYVTVPIGFKEDTWVTSMEMRPGSKPVLTHHYCIFLVPHKDGVQYGVFSETGMMGQVAATGNAPFEGCYEKGQEEFDYRPQHAGRLIPANSDMVFQMHYQPNGEEAIDQPQVGFTIARERPSRQYVFFNVGAGLRLNIPANEANYIAPAQEGELQVDGEIVWLQAHAHYRAKEMKFDILYPDGRDETALRVNWDPYWQTIYYPVQPIITPKGTRLHIEGRYDNSANNPYNPDHDAAVHFGDQGKDEMMFPTFGVIVDGSLDLTKVQVLKPSPLAGPDFVIAEKTPK